MATEYVAPTGELINETDTIEVVTPFGSFLNETSGSDAGGGVPKSTKFFLLGVG